MSQIGYYISAQATVTKRVIHKWPNMYISIIAHNTDSIMVNTLVSTMSLNYAQVLNNKNPNIWKASLKHLT